MNSSKRCWQPTNDPTSIDWPPSKRSASSSNEYSSDSDFDLSWDELWPSLLGVEPTIPIGYDGPGLVEEEIYKDVAEYGIGDQITEAAPAIANVSHDIQSWAEETVAFNKPEAAGITTVHQGGEHLDQHHAGQNIKCFGMIHALAARLIGNMLIVRSELIDINPAETTFPLELAFTGRFVSLISGCGTQMGQLQDSLTESLKQISEIPSVRLQAFANVLDTLRRIDGAKRQHDADIQVDINVYGTITVRDEVGKRLSENKLYLQDTKYPQDGVDYDNPHMLVFDDIDLAFETAVQTSACESSVPVGSSQWQETVKAVCQAETRDRGLRGLKPNRVGTHVMSKLLAHQEQALEFMIQRELGPIPEGFQLWRHDPQVGYPRFRHAITGAVAPEALSELGGGILADDMGMGKSLSMLSLVTQRLSEGWDWSQSSGSEASSEDTQVIRSRATLLVVPSLLIMNNTWFREIKKHLDGSLNVTKYHGKRREGRMEVVAESDIVLTTYHTLAAEQKSKRSPLKSIKWFRIVLDEAHTIKRQATTLFTAVSELSACHRWCLTGTPIQNSIDDLGALLVFIRAEPFESVSVFRKYVSTPFRLYEDLQEAAKKLQMLLNSVCLRRRIERLHLPPMTEATHHVELSGKERCHYDTTFKFMAYAVSHRYSLPFAKTPFGAFQIQLQLRLLCNHGTFQKPFERGQDDDQNRREDVLNCIGTDGEIRCALCHEKAPILETNCAASRQSQACAHVFCHECISQTMGESQAPASAFACPCCATHSNRLRPSAQRRALGQPKRPNNTVFDTISGYSAKMKRLMDDVMEGLSSKKSIIFSSWTRSLDLVAFHLDQRRIGYVRIDGDTAMGKRQQILDEFADGTEIRILLMTTGTGAYGLNLSVANRIFLLEPQWNPSVEKQAIARAQRFLQNQVVQVIRYIVRGTVEEDIQRQQRKKMNDAEMGFDRGDRH